MDSHVIDVVVGSFYQHRKGGQYKVVALGRIEATLAPVVIYAALKDDTVWVRPLDEFADGRFTLVDDFRDLQKSTNNC